MYENFISNLQVPEIQESPLTYALKNLEIGDGEVLEFGVYFGTTITEIANTLSGRYIFGFDSFKGLPEEWTRPDMHFGKGAFTLDGNLPKVPKNVKLVKGWFEESIPKFIKEYEVTKVSFVHIDCDIYSSTKTVFDNLAPLFHDGTILVFDELFNYPNCKEHELKALYEMVTSYNYNIEWVGKMGPVTFETVPQYSGCYYERCALILRK